MNIEQLIKLKTGQSSDAMRGYNCVNDAQLEQLSDVVACKCSKAEEAKVDTNDVVFIDSSLSAIDTSVKVTCTNVGLTMLSVGNITGSGISININVYRS